MFNKLRSTLIASMCAISLFNCGPGFETASPQVEMARAKNALLVDDIFNRLKNVESQLPIFPATQNVQVGTFDAYSGDFQGSDYTYAIDPFTHKPVKRPVVVALNAIAPVLQFYISNSSVGPTTLTLGSRSVTVPAGTPMISLNLESDSGGVWQIRTGSKWHDGFMTFTKNGVNGAGAFTLSVLPITIVYEPPQNAAKTNSAQVTISQQTSSVTSLSRTDDSSFKGVSDWQEITETVATVDKIANAIAPGSGVLSGALKTVGSALGTVNTTVTQGTSVNSDHSLGLSTTNTVSVSTQLKKGPGLGDVFFFYRNARVAWFMFNGNITTTLLDPGTLVQTTAEQLKLDLADLDGGIKTPSQTATQLTANNIRELLTLNPSAIPSTPAGATPRFVKEHSLSISGGSGFSQSVSHVMTETDKTTKTKFTTTVSNAHAGWLSAIGIGVSQSGETTTKVSMSSSQTDSVTQTQTAAIQLSAAAGETYNADIYFDRVFGSFRVVKPRAPFCCKVISGVLTNKLTVAQ